MPRRPSCGRVTRQHSILCLTLPVSNDQASLTSRLRPEFTSLKDFFAEASSPDDKSDADNQGNQVNSHTLPATTEHDSPVPPVTKDGLGIEAKGPWVMQRSASSNPSAMELSAHSGQGDPPKPTGSGGTGCHETLLPGASHQAYRTVESSPLLTTVYISWFQCVVGSNACCRQQPPSVTGEME